MIIPIKPWALAKSRMATDSSTRAMLAEAFARDVLEVVSSSGLPGLVVVVTAEAGVASVARMSGAALITDHPLRSGDGHIRAITAGRHWCSAHAPDDRVVVLPADLPALTTDSFDQTLTLLARHERAFVPDAAGSGTTMLAARRPSLLRPTYGRASALRHSAGGSKAVLGASPRVRLDVDTMADLREALHLGCGAHTTEVASRTGHHPDR